MPAIDPFENFQNDSITFPPDDAFEITPHNSNELEAVTREIYVGQAGDLAVETLKGNVVTYRNVVAGMYYTMRVRKVLATGTTAAYLVGRP